MPRGCVATTVIQTGQTDLFYSEAFIYRPFSDVALDWNSSKTVVATHPYALLLAES
jgi:hypothetical protein